MAGTINAANITIGLDIAKLQSGMNATRGEMNQLKSILKESREPVEEFESKMNLLSRALQAGGITIEQYERAQEKLAAKFGVVTPAMERRAAAIESQAKAEREAKIMAETLAIAEKERLQILARGKQLTDSVRTATEIHSQKVSELRSLLTQGAITQETYNRAIQDANWDLIKAEQSMSKLTHATVKQNEAVKSSALSGIRGFLGGKLQGAIAGAAGAFTVSSMFGQIKDIDDTADAAEKVGLSYRELIVLQRTLGESAAVSSDQVTGGIGKMMVNLANARDKGGELDISLKKLGLSSRQLASMDAVTAFTTIQQKFSQISGQADKMQFAMQLFGKAGIEMVPALEVGADKFAEMESHLERSGALLTQMQAEQMGALVDKVERFGDAWKGFAASAAPVMERIVTNSARWLDNWKTFFEAFGPNAIADMSSEDRKRWEDQQAIANIERIRVERKKAEEAEIAAEQERVLARMDALIERNHKANLERQEKEAKERDKALADQEKAFAAADKAIQDEKRKSVEDELRKLQSQADRLAGQKFGENNSNIAPAIKAGTVEAYKFVNKQNDEAKAREEAKRQREEVIAQIRKLNEKNFAILAKAR